MALLHSLEIIGIRNFSPDDRQTIYFSTPVVLFQGPNGSGKTTILECIRYALTGELPPDIEKGKRFVHEPKMSNKTITKGSVKIEFFDADENMITVQRNVQVQRKSVDLQFKRLNHTIRRRAKDAADIWQDISGHVSDIDSYCCNVLNVSKSIFNNVLFCHQENSLWPLDQPKKLKEKFDDIFDAARYNKCIDAIRECVKEKKQQKSKLNEELIKKENQKIQAEKTRDKFEEIRDKLKEIQNAIEINNKEIPPLQKRMEAILELEETFRALQTRLTGKEEEQKGLVDQQKTLTDNMTFVFEGSDEELEAKINSFNEERNSEELSIKTIEKNIQEINKQIVTQNNNIQDKQLGIGRMKEEQKQYGMKTEECLQLMDKLRLELEIKQFDDKEVLLVELSNALKNQQNKFAELKREKELEEKQYQDQIDTRREKHAGTKESVSSKNTTVNDCNNKLKYIRSKLEDLNKSHSELIAVNEKIEKSQQTLEILKNSFNESEKLNEIEQLKEQIDNKEQYLDKLDREYRVLQQNYLTEQKLDSGKSIIIENQGRMNRIKSKHSENLKALFRDNIPEKNLAKSVLNIQNQQEVEFRNYTKNVNELEKTLTALKTNLNHQRNKLKTDQQELSINKKKLDSICNGKNLSDMLKETYTKKGSIQRRKGYFASVKIVFEAFAREIDENKCCPVCQTGFEKNTSAIPSIVRDLKNKIVEVPEKLNQAETELKREEKIYNELQQLISVNDDVEMMLNTKIPELEKEINNITVEFDEKSMELAAEKLSLEAPQKLTNICKDLIADSTLFDQYQTDLIKANAAIEDLEESMEKVPSNRTRQETEMEIDLVKGELSNAKNRYATNKNLLDQYRDRCQDLNREMQTEVKKQIDIQKLVQEKPLLEMQNTEYEEQIKVLRAEIEDLQLSLVSQENDLKQAIDKKDNIIKTNRDIQDEYQNKINSCQNSLSDIHKLERGIQDYDRNGGDAKLNEALKESVEFKVILGNLEKTKSESLSSIFHKKEALAKKESDFRALKDNVTLRGKRKQEEAVSTEIIDIKQKIRGYNYPQLFDEKTRKSVEIDETEREIIRLNGQLEQVQEQHDKLEDELEKPENKNASNNYKKQYYEVCANDLCIDDLNRYVNILERSILKFHQERMVHINRTLRNLWRIIYRGNDIDFIEIKNEENINDGESTKRMYDYKVVQVKNNVELEMRGRCSAGQKVLACLVIRMALAETFSSHCGILALDEPTTNLDKANVSSLSDTLSELIKNRENELNFQLLIITHDEDFLRSLTQVQSLESYWQIKRSVEGSSTVEKIML